METGVEAKASVKNLYLLKNRWYVMLIKSNYKYIYKKVCGNEWTFLCFINVHSFVLVVHSQVKSLF